MGVFSGPSIETRAQSEQPAAAEDRMSYFAPTVPAWIGSSDAPIVTAETAPQSVAIRTTADLIASLGSELPINVTSGTGEDARDVPTPGNLEDPGGDGRGREDWAYRLFWSWLITGNSFGDVIDGDVLHPRTVDLINANQVSPSVVDGAAVWYVNGRKAAPSTFAHWRVNPVAGRLLGLSPIEHHASTIGISLATTRFGKQWFTDGAHPGGMLTNEAELDAQQSDTAKKRFLASQGTREPVVLGKGWSWEEIQISPEESQFLQTSGMSEAQCARIFGPGWAEILGYETGSKMTYSNIVDRRQDLLVLSMNRWVRRYERVLKLFLPPGQQVRVNREALLEATTIQRYAAHESALRNKWRTVNEVRKIEHLKPVPWGDEPNESNAPSTGTETSDGNTSGS